MHYNGGAFVVKSNGVYILNIDGQVHSYNTQFKAEPAEDCLIVTGGVVNGELFAKQELP